MCKARKNHSQESFGRILQNNLFAIEWQMKIAPGYTIYTILITVYHEMLVLFQHTYLVAYIIGCIEENRTFGDVLSFLLSVATASFFYQITNTWVNCFVRPKALAKIKKEIQLTLYEKAVNMEISRYDKSDFYNDFVWAMQKASTHITTATDTFKILLSRVIVAVATGAFIISSDAVSLVAVGLLLVLTLVFQSIGNKLRMSREEEVMPHTRRRDYINRVFYLIDYVKDLKMSDMAGRLEKDFQESAEKIKKISAKRGSQLTGVNALLSVSENIIFTGIYLSYLFYQALVKSKYGIGTLLAIYNSTNKLRNTLLTITKKLPEFQEHSMYVEKLRTFLATENEMTDGTKAVLEGGDLCLEKVQFTYKGNAEPTLKNVSMEIKKGEKVALVGFNGAGKSTLIKLLLRLYDPDSGRITYGGQDIRDYKLKEYRKQFGALFQDFEIFATDIQGNICMKDGELDQEWADQAMQKAGFWERFSLMPKGYGTQLTKEFDSEGINLSGGEAQKLALARVLYADAAVIVLDEPSSALDPIAEHQLNKTITELSNDKTVIIISHRLSTTRFVDRIYMFENGEIIEQGVHEELIMLNGAYAKMFKLQAEKYR